MSLSIITVTYNSANETAAFVASLATQDVPWELWLVDNASRDDTPAQIAKAAEADNRIHTICNFENIGLAAANNQPLPSLTSTYVAIINPDVVLHPGSLRVLTDYLASHEDVVAAAPVNVDDDGTPHSSFHRNWTLKHLLLWRIFPSRFTRWIYQRVRTYGEQNVLFASGACIVMRTEDFRAIDGYDPAYFLTVEDVCDLCIRLRMGHSDRRVVVVPQARITHLKSRSAIGVPFVTLWYGAFGSIHHFRKHHGLVAGYAAFAIVLLSTAMRVLLGILRAPFGRRHRTSFTNNMRVLGRLFTQNPLFQSRK